MKRQSLGQAGSLLIPLIIVLVLFLSSLGFGVWAFAGRQDYKNNSDAKATTAAKLAAAKESAKKDAEFAIAEKSPLSTYTSPLETGSITLSYPKTWNQYHGKATTDKQLDDYFNPDFVPDVASGLPFALRIQILNKPYVTTLASFEKNVIAGKSVVSAYRLSKVSSVLGSSISGPVASSLQGTIVMLPIRDKTLLIWTEGTSFSSDFNNIILPSVSFTP